MVQKIRLSGYRVIRFLIVLLIHSSFVISNPLVASFVEPSFSLDVPRFRGDEVVVTGSRVPQKLSQTPWDTTVITGDELANYRTVGEALRSVVGVDSQSYGYLGSLNSVRLRGANASQVLIMIDGRRVNSPTLGMADAGDLLLGDVEKIEVVRAPLSAIYGSDAVAGAINIITKAPLSARTMFSASAGSFNTQQYQFSYNGGGYNLDAGAIKSDGFRRNGDYQANSLAGKIIYPTAFGQLMIDGSVYDAVKGVPGVPTSETVPDSATEPNDRQKDNNLLIGVTLNNKDYQLKVFQNSYDQRLEPYLFGASHNRTVQTGLDFQQKLGNFLYGVEAREDNGKTTMSGDHTIWNYAAFVQDELVVANNCTVVAGIRGDKHSTAGKAINPRIGLVYLPVSEVTLRASAGTAFRAPTLNELYWDDGWMFGNTGLKPEKSFSYELGLERRFGANLLARVNYYATTTTDLILWDWQSSTIETRAKNIGEAFNEGVEFELERKLGGRGRAFANFTYQKAVDQKDFDPLAVGKTLRYTPQSKYNIGLVLDGMSVVIRHIGERFADSYNTVTLAAYTVVDLKLGYKMKNVDLELAINNLFDEKYSEAVGNDPLTYAVRQYPMPGRSCRLGVKWGI